MPLRQRDGLRQDKARAAAPAGEELRQVKQRGEDLLAAADDAIERALSEDSEKFLRANRQQGGE